MNRFFQTLALMAGLWLLAGAALAQAPQPPEIAARSYLLLDVSANQVLAEAERLLVLYDNAGEHFLPGADQATRPVTRHLGRSEAIVFAPTKVNVPPLLRTRFVFVAICWADVSVRLP